MSNGRLDRPVFVGADDSVVVNLFHGGYKVIDKVDPDYLKQPGDFSYGFYMTDREGVAIERAIQKTAGDRFLENRNVVNVFSLDMEGLRYVKFDSPSLQWLETISKGRKGIPLKWNDELIDVVIGPIADGKNIRYAISQFESLKECLDALEGNRKEKIISDVIKDINRSMDGILQMTNAIHDGKTNGLAMQYALLTQKSWDRLELHYPHIYDRNGTPLRNVGRSRTEELPAKHRSTVSNLHGKVLVPNRKKKGDDYGLHF